MLPSIHLVPKDANGELMGHAKEIAQRLGFTSERTAFIHAALVSLMEDPRTHVGRDGKITVAFACMNQINQTVLLNNPRSGTIRRIDRDGTIFVDRTAVASAEDVANFKSGVEGLLTARPATTVPNQDDTDSGSFSADETVEIVSGNR